MVGSFDVEISTDKLKYIFSIDHKFTILQGNSGTGKTTLAELLDLKLVSPTQVIINSKVNIRHFNINESVDTVTKIIDSYTDELIVIDETYAYLDNASFIQSLVRSNAYFLIISRYPLKYLPDNSWIKYNIISIKEDNGTINCLEAI